MKRFQNSFQVIMNNLNEKIETALRTKRHSAQEDTTSAKKLKDLKLNKNFFNVPCLTLAEALLGKVLTRKLTNDVILKGRIVETECYPGGTDKASHSYNGRRTVCNEPMYMNPGTAYVYIIYGIYHCFNISSSEEGGAVLIRALEPLEGMNEMLKFRTVKKSRDIKEQDLCKGPANLCTSFDISKKNCNKIDLTENALLWLENDPNFTDSVCVIRTSRIGISSVAEEWVHKPLRFYIKGNVSVSKHDRLKEKELSVT